jgi:hypothetical protein
MWSIVPDSAAGLQRFYHKRRLRRNRTSDYRAAQQRPAAPRRFFAWIIPPQESLLLRFVHISVIARKHEIVILPGFQEERVIEQFGPRVEKYGRKALFVLAVVVLTAVPAFSQVFNAGNLVVTVEGNGVNGATSGPYTDNQAGPLTLFQFIPNGTSSPATFLNSFILPQTASGANSPVSAEYGSSSEGTLQLSGNGFYLTVMGYGVNAAAFNASPSTYGNSGVPALGQSGSLQGLGYTPVPRVVALIDANGNVNSATALLGVFDQNNPRSAYSADGTNIYVSGQGNSPDPTGGVFFTTLGSSSATAITGLDTSTNASSQDTRDVQIYNGTLYISVDSKEGSGSNRDFVGTLGTPPATSLYDGSGGPTMLAGFGDTKGHGQVTITSGANTNGNGLNAGLQINLSPENYFFANATTLYVADGGSPKQTSANSPLGDGGLQKWTYNGSSWALDYTIAGGLNLVKNSSSAGSTGLYGLTGRLINGGTQVELFATNYTIGALDPTYLYAVTDTLSTTTNPNESFTQIAQAPVDSNFKGVAFAPSLIPPTVVTGQVSVTASGLLYSRVTKLFTGTVTIQNTSAQPIVGPIKIGFTALPSGVTLANATGTYSGNPYIAVPSISALAPGQSATVSMQYSNPSLAGINFTPVIYSGSVN